MKKIYLEKQLREPKNYPVEEIKIIEILNENYGENRDIDKNL